MQQHGVAIVVGIRSRSGVATIVIGEERPGPTEGRIVRKVGDFREHLLQNRKLRNRSWTQMTPVCVLSTAKA
jgi:acetyl-CoA carboxylase alpha subunit